MDMTDGVIDSVASPARSINFKCVDSPFFSEFDGAWTVKEQHNPVTGETETLFSYVIDVRSKGPVPVAALEWRIPEDVCTNLPAVKVVTLGMNPAAAEDAADISTGTRTPSLASPTAIGKSQQDEAFPVRVANCNTASWTKKVPTPCLALVVVVDWDVDETMGKYLKQQHHVGMIAPSPLLVYIFIIQNRKAILHSTFIQIMFSDSFFVQSMFVVIDQKKW
jgi:hypothetical protein